MTRRLAVVLLICLSVVACRTVEVPPRPSPTAPSPRATDTPRRVPTAAPKIAPTAVPPTAPPGVRPATKWGVHLLLDDGDRQWLPAVWEEHLTYARWLVGPGGWVVELPTWLKVLVYANPVSYLLDLLRLVTLGFSQLPLAANLAVVLVFPLIAVLLAARAMVGLRQR